MDAPKVLNNRYQLLSVIKKGGFGIIYKGYDSVLGKDIAVKEIKPELLGEAWYVEQFQKEARHAAKMNHQNIVHIFDLVQTDDRNFYIVMEHIDGLDLKKVVQECRDQGKQMPMHLAVHVIAEICKALDYAHNCASFENNEPLHLVHQDISPGNIMISRNGVVKLIDFGIAGVQRKSIDQKNYISLQGKIPYMSPEHVSQETRLDKRSDLFSLGLVLYEVLEGKRFFANESSQSIIETLRNGKLKIKDLRASPKPLQDILHRALEKSPDRRYQNANQFYIDLVTYLVLQADTSALDSELANFVSKITNQPIEDKNLFDMPNSDILFDDVIEDIQETAPQPGERQHAQDLEDSMAELADNDVSHSSVPVVPPATPPPEPSNPDFDSYYQAGDEVKTVIDAVRLSTRGHKKLVIRSLIGMAALTLLFFGLDFVFQWTTLGTDIYDAVFPPDVKIASVPSDAKVYLNDKPVSGTTPLSIDNIKPGVYELKLVAEGYHPIIKSLHIPSKGEVQIKGERSRPGNQPYLFRFKTSLKIDSKPEGAEVYINNIKYGQNTPCSITWEVGEPVEIKLRKTGYKELAGFSLETENMLERVDDKRVWQFNVTKEPTIRAEITGLFGKFFTFKSNPADALILLDNNSDPIGRTGEQSHVFLTAGKHKIVFAKKGYNKKVINLAVNEATPSEVFASLSRPVKFVAYDATNGKAKDLGATITRIVRKGKTVIRGKRTPTTLNLLALTYEAYFSKQGFRDVKVKVSPRDDIITAKMEPVDVPFSVVIIDKNTGAPLSNVEVRYKSLDNPNTSEVLFDITDGDGTCSGRLKPGLYLFRTSKNSFSYQEKSVMIQPKGLNLIEFNLEKL